MLSKFDPSGAIWDNFLNLPHKTDSGADMDNRAIMDNCLKLPHHMGGGAIQDKCLKLPHQSGIGPWGYSGQNFLKCKYYLKYNILTKYKLNKK